MNNEITPLPWRTGKQNGHGGIEINAGKCETVATVYLGLSRSDTDWNEPTFALPENRQAVANAEYICHAANALPECVKALEDAKYYLEGRASVNPLPAIKSALRQAKGKK